MRRLNATAKHSRRLCRTLSGASLAAASRASPPKPPGRRSTSPARSPKTWRRSIYGIKSGMFGRAGLDVEIVGTNSGSAATAAVVAGTYEMAKTSLLSVFSAHLRDIPIVIVAPRGALHAAQPRRAAADPVDAAIQDRRRPQRQDDRRALAERPQHLVSKAWVDKNGGDSSTLKFVEIPNSAQPQALAQHRIDAAIIESPALDASLAAGTSKTLADPMGAIAPTYMIAAFIARADWAAQHADVLRRFNRTLAEAATYVNAHHAETHALVAELTKIELANAAKMSRTVGGHEPRRGARPAVHRRRRKVRHDRARLLRERSHVDPLTVTCFADSRMPQKCVRSAKRNNSAQRR